MKIVTLNRKARFEYHILETLTAGLILQGNEVKAVKKQGCNISNSYIGVYNDSPLIYQMQIEQYKYVSRRSFDYKYYHSTRARELLLNKREIDKLMGKLKEEGVTAIPLKVFISDHGFVKIEFGICKGKKLHDKRAAIKARDWSRDKRSLQV